MSRVFNLVEIYKGTVPATNDYVVHGATVVCTCGSGDAHMIFPDRGYDTGYFRIGLDTDTSAIHNFSNMFGICKCTTEYCKPFLVERWVETAKRQNVNEGHPLLMKSMLICKRGGILYFKESGQSLEE